MKSSSTSTKQSPTALISVTPSSVLWKTHNNLEKPIHWKQRFGNISLLLLNGSESPILIVEDDEATMKGLKHILEGRGIANHGIAAAQNFPHGRV